MSDPSPDDFKKASEGSQPSLGRELIDLLRKNRKWWLIPILVAIAIIALLITLSATGLAPFIYPL